MALTRAKTLLTRSAKARARVLKEIKNVHTKGADLARKALSRVRPERNGCGKERTTTRPFIPTGPHDKKKGPLPCRNSTPAPSAPRPSPSSSRGPSRAASTERRRRTGKARRKSTPPAGPSRPPTREERAVAAGAPAAAVQRAAGVLNGGRVRPGVAAPVVAAPEVIHEPGFLARAPRARGNNELRQLQLSYAEGQNGERLYVRDPSSTVPQFRPPPGSSNSGYAAFHQGRGMHTRSKAP